MGRKAAELRNRTLIPVISQLSNDPFFSIIIPTYARPRQLTACIASLARLRYPDDRFEVIVVDDGSRTSLEPVIAPFRNRISISLICQSHAGPSVARNQGAARARGAYLAFTDDDCTLAPDWLNRAAELVSANPESAVGGQTINAYTDNPFSTASQLLLDFLYEYHMEHQCYDQFLASNNFIVSARLFRALGGFNETFIRPGAEDRELCFRLLSCGGAIVYAPNVLAYHSHWLNLSTFWQQHFRYGRGAFHYHRLRQPHMPDTRRLKRPSFYTRLLLYPLVRKTDVRAPLLMALLAVSQIANASGYFGELVRNGLARVTAPHKFRPEI